MSETRIQSFEGEIKKCPSCGAVLPSMVTKCPECGYEIRGVEAADSLKKFQKEYQIAAVSKNIDNIVALVTSFPIPNTKEDFLEFLTISKAEAEKDVANKNDEKIREAWISKFKQLSEKSKLIFVNDNETLKQVQNIIASAKIKKGVRLSFKSKLLIIIIPLAIIIVFMMSPLSRGIRHDMRRASESKQAQNELELILKEFEMVENGEIVVSKENIFLPGTMGKRFEITSDIKIKFNPENDQMTVDFEISNKTGSVRKELKQMIAEELQNKGIKPSNVKSDISCWFSLFEGHSLSTSNTTLVFDLEKGESAKIHDEKKCFFYDGEKKALVNKLLETKNTNIFTINKMRCSSSIEMIGSEDEVAYLSIE